jgi:heptosyltransferase-3
VPCRHEGCERHVDSRSDCLTNLGTQRVKAAAADMLGLSRPDTTAIAIDTSRLHRSGSD